MDRFAGSLNDPGHVYLMAVESDRDGLPVGLVEASVVSPSPIFRPKAVLHVHALYVEPLRRGEGMGRRLLERALGWGKERGCVEAELKVLVLNPARHLYDRFGFSISELEMRRKL